MDNYFYELFFVTILAILICLRGILSFLYIPILRSTSLSVRGRKFILTRMFGSTSKISFYGFWISLIWLILQGIKYKEFLLCHLM